MMKFIWIALFALNTAYAAKPKYGPAGSPFATPLSSDSTYFKKAGNQSDFFQLAPYYVSQFNEAACSVASLTSVVNAIRKSKPLTSDDKLISQEAILDKVTALDWKKRIVEKDGVGGARGTTLEQLGQIADAALKAYGIKGSVQILHVEDTKPKTIAAIKSVLAKNEKSRTNFIIANFIQSAFTDDSEAGHISPVGAYDAASDRVLVMDVDREWYEPYWVSTAQFVKGLATKDSGAKQYRGLVLIELK